MNSSCLLEACVGSVEAALAAEGGGADRVELCSDLLEGGCTPSPASIRLAHETLSIPMHVIIRPRGGDFLYSDVEFETMKRDVDFAGEVGADGVVIGILQEDGRVDARRTGALVEWARPMSVTFHRAFDVARDAFEALDALAHLGADRVLTSGQESTALKGLGLLAELVKRAGTSIIVMPGGGINERNLEEIAKGSGAREFHARAPITVESRMKYRNERVFMGGATRPPEYAIEETDPKAIAALAGILKHKKNV